MYHDRLVCSSTNFHISKASVNQRRELLLLEARDTPRMNAEDDPASNTAAIRVSKLTETLTSNTAKDIYRAEDVSEK